MIIDFGTLKSSDIELLNMLCLGMNDRQIAYRMNVKDNTIRTRLVAIKNKVGILGNRNLLAVEYTKWNIAQQGIVNIVREWLEVKGKDDNNN